MADRLRITELDFDTIKTNLKTFLKQQETFSDYDFDGSGLSVLLDTLAYNTHYNAYYLNMVANEAFMDTALLRDSVVSHAKSLGYTPYSRKAPVATIDVRANSTSSTAGTLTIPAGYSFLSNQIDGVAYNFIVLEDTVVSKSNTSYFFDDLQISEGQYVTYTFTQDNATNPKQVFTLPDENIDTTTIKVSVSPSLGNTQTSIYTKVEDTTNVTTTSEVFFVQESKNKKYQIYFGNNTTGKKLGDGNIITVNYLSTNGSEANKANNFVASSTLTDSLGESLSTFTITPVSPASGGAERETIDEIKASATSQFTSQNRLVTAKDYESFVKKNYPAVDSLSVWGGEENIPPVYGKVFVSLKAKDNYYISETEKKRIVDEIIKPKTIGSIQTEIVEPAFLYLLVENYVEYFGNKTTQTDEALKDAIRTAIINYKNANINKFDATFVLSKLQDVIDAVDLNAIRGSETKLSLQKRFTPTLNTAKKYTLSFNAELHRGSLTDKLTSTEIKINDNLGIERTAQIEEVPNSFSGITSINVSDAGSGYTEIPTVTITGDGTGATAEAVIINRQIQSITITNKGINYTRALVTITGGNGVGATATAVLDARFGTLRTVYFDSLSQKQIIDSNAGTIDYDTGEVILSSLKVNSVVSGTEVKVTVEAEKGIISSLRDTIITIDEEDSSSIKTELVKV